MANQPKERPPYEIVVADTPERLQACLDIRIQGSLPFSFSLFGLTGLSKVFVTEQGISYEDEIDQYDTDPQEAAGVIYLLLNKVELSDTDKETKRLPIGVVRIIPARNKASHSYFPCWR